MSPKHLIVTGSAFARPRMPLSAGTDMASPGVMEFLEAALEEARLRRIRHRHGSRGRGPRMVPVACRGRMPCRQPGLGGIHFQPDSMKDASIQENARSSSTSSTLRNFASPSRVRSSGVGPRPPVTRSRSQSSDRSDMAAAIQSMSSGPERTSDTPIPREHNLRTASPNSCPGIAHQAVRHR